MIKELRGDGSVKHNGMCVRVFYPMTIPTSKLSVQEIPYYDYVCFLRAFFTDFLKSEEIVLAVSPLLVGNLGR